MQGLCLVGLSLLARSLPKAEWTHEAHLAACAWLVLERPDIVPQRDLPGITGKVGDIKKGSVRDGGSFSKRIGHYSSWNSYFTQATYQIKRWNDFLSA